MRNPQPGDKVTDPGSHRLDSIFFIPLQLINNPAIQERSRCRQLPTDAKPGAIQLV